MKYAFFILLLLTIHAYGQNSVPKISHISVGNTRCNGDNTGSITITASGTNPLVYFCDGTKQSSNTFLNLKAGNHTVKVINKAGVDTSAVFIRPPEAPLKVTCFGRNIPCGDHQLQGDAGADVTGGKAPYQYQWNNGSTTKKVSGLQPGFYTVRVTDSMGCRDSCSTSIEPAKNLTVKINSNDPTCNGSDGLVNIDTGFLGGMPPYRYLWNNGSVTPFQQGLQGGTYQVTVTDANHCSGSDSVTLVQQGSAKAKYKAGDSMSCGYVFYVDPNPDSSHPCSTHYLVCAFKDLDSKFTWYNNDYTKTGAKLNILFDKENADKISPVSSAAAACAGYKTGDSSCAGWYLPSRAELDSMHANLASKGIGGFAQVGYWSSVEGSKRHKAWAVDFDISNGQQVVAGRTSPNGRGIQRDKANKSPVRPVCEVWIVNE